MAPSTSIIVMTCTEAPRSSSSIKLSLSLAYERHAAARAARQEAAHAATTAALKATTVRLALGNLSLTATAARLDALVAKLAARGSR